MRASCQLLLSGRHLASSALLCSACGEKTRMSNCPFLCVFNSDMRIKVFRKVLGLVCVLLYVFTRCPASFLSYNLDAKSEKQNLRCAVGSVVCHEGAERLLLRPAATSHSGNSGAHPELRASPPRGPQQITLVNLVWGLRNVE